MAGDRKPSMAAGAPLLAAMLALCACGHGGSGALRGAACAGCHPVEAAAFELSSSHRILFDCTFCHEELDVAAGPDHRDTTWCDHCHSEVAHPPPEHAEAEPAASGGEHDASRGCPTCHDPHGSANLFLIRELVHTPAGDQAEVAFTDLSGRADFSYAELSAADGGENEREAGEGLCEICHARTRFYDRWGTGETHHVERCVHCHDHALGFAVAPANRAAGTRVDPF